MEELLDQADALVASSEYPERPDFALPEEYSAVSIDDYAQRIPTANGQGWVATRDISAGTLILVEKPIAMVMDWKEYVDEPESDDMERDEDDESYEEEPEPKLNQLLLLQLLERLQTEPTLWKDVLTTLYPRPDDLAKLPAWVCADDAIFLQVEASIQALSKIPLLQNETKEISTRLPLIIRYNILSVETCPELLSYPNPDGHSSLGGVALYHYASFFNHSARPTCSRWAIGDVLAIVTHQDVSVGQELTISYLEHDVLCEPPYRRNQMLRMDFWDGDNDQERPSSEEDHGPDIPVVDPDVQNELMAMDPLERLTAMDELLQQALGNKAPTDEVDTAVETNGDIAMQQPAWFQCDIQNLRILKAITLDSLGQTKEALELWEAAVDFCDQNLPSNDESGVVLRVQAALCAWHLGAQEQARRHAQAALQTHQLLFGGGVVRFRRRLQRDLDLQFRPIKKDDDSDESPRTAVDQLWPMPS